ncbi:asnS [Symbiodinium microadriaticum]|nr:asnS [Symbiodinium microadriaticum]CAE7892650.1 asnS [Symbiodinium sp. KB8]
MPGAPCLVASPSDVSTQKILVAAHAAGVDLRLEAPKTPGPPEIRLEVAGNNQCVRYANAILRFIGRYYDGVEVYGSTFFESAEVDSWLDWGEMELANPPLQMEQALETLEKHLDQRVFLVGQRFTIADASLSVALHSLQSQGLATSLPRATKRWLGTCMAQEAFAAVIKGAKPSAASASAPSAPSAKPKAAEQPFEDRYSSAVGGRSEIKRIVAAEDQGKSLVGKKVSVCGWVRTAREADKGKIMFVQLNDGSTPLDIQVVIDSGTKGFDSLKGKVGTGASMKCTGEVVASPGGKQAVEVLVKGDGCEVILFGGVDAKEYPLSKKGHSHEFLRSIAHLRPRSNLIGCVARVRSALAYATHEFFRSNGFMYVHTPLITAADCEGAGEMFQVTTMMAEAEKDGKPLPMVNGKFDYTKDFFQKPAFLTVSGQLSVENYCCALSKVYTFGPTFRAENSHTSRHLAEFWMIEPELAFADIHDDMNVAEDYLKYCVRYVMENHKQDLDFFEDKIEKGLIKRLENLLAEPFARVTYTEAIDILLKESPKANFQVPVEWGMDLGSEHERHLAEKVFKKPTVVYNYPKDIKAFYMRLNEDNKTVAAMDVLAPAIGEVIGGSQREERLDVLDRRITEMDLNPQDYWWYRDLRRYGSVPHSGFGLGFERLIMLTTGVENIRDVIPYPRYPGHAEF